MSSISEHPIYKGLDNIYVSETKMSHIDGEKGKLTIRGYPLEEFASLKTNEEVSYLLMYGRFPNKEERSSHVNELRSHRNLPDATFNLIEAAAKAGVHSMSALQMAVSSLSIEFGDVGSDDLEKVKHVGLQLVAKVPTVLAAYWRVRSGKERVAPRRDLGQAENFLYMLNGEVPSEEEARGLETYLNVVSDHGFNASTFVARAIVSTNSDIISGIAGAIGSLKGDKHGGAPGPALDMIHEIGEVENVRTYVEKKLANKEVIMGFGHRVYKVRDPRAYVLSEAAERLYVGEKRLFYDKVIAMEQEILKTLEELKPGRKIMTNVEFFTALVLQGVGLRTDIFSSMFAMGRIAGWVSHIVEQYSDNRLIRPRARYIGEFDLKLN